MTFSKLMYSRNLVKEAFKIERLLAIEYGKCRRNTEKIGLLKQTQDEVRAERAMVAKAVEEWIAQTPTSNEFQHNMREFFVKGNGVLVQNFHRDVEYLLGENKHYKQKKD